MNILNFLSELNEEDLFEQIQANDAESTLNTAKGFFDEKMYMLGAMYYGKYTGIIATIIHPEKYLSQNTLELAANLRSFIFKLEGEANN